MVKKSSCWAVVPLDFESGACKKYHKEGRLVSVQVFVEGGKRSIIIVAFYGHAGARWESDKKEAVNRMLRDLSSEMAGRGGMPIIVTGDFNIQVDESTVIREMLRSGGMGGCSCVCGSGFSRINPHVSKVKGLVSIYAWLIVQLRRYCPSMRCETAFRTKITVGYALQ